MEAIAIILDVGPSMNQAPPGLGTPLESAREGINMILQRKIFSESKDEIALLLVGTTDTDNPLAKGENYQNITLKRRLGIADFDLLKQVQTELQPSDTPGDFIEAIVVAMDHLENATQGKKGIGSRRIILFSDLGSPFGDQELEKIVNAMQITRTELDVIGPNLDQSEEDEPKEKRGGADAHPDGVKKEKTRQQRSGEALIKHILDQVEGSCYSFSEVLPALSNFLTRQIRPRAWKCNLEIGNLQFPICAFYKIKEYELKQSWKKVYAQNTDKKVVTSRTYHINDERETEVEKEDTVEEYRYGVDLVTMSEDDKDNMKYTATKCLNCLGFTEAENFKKYHILGDGVLSITAEKGDEAAAIALSAFIHALYETDTVAIARRVYDENLAPRIGCLFPHIKNKYERLFWVELPFSEDIRTFTFDSLPLKEDAVINKKYKPSDDQLKAVDDLISSMDLSQALEDEDGEKEEALKPKLTFNPYFQRVYQCLQYRALNPDEKLPELSPFVARYLQPPSSLITKSKPMLQEVKKKFKLEVKEEDKTVEIVINKENETAASGPPLKKKKLDDDLAGRIKNITNAEVTEVGSMTPIEDFIALVSRRDDMFKEACEQMQKRIEQIVMLSFGQQICSKALDCLRTLRQECVKKSEPKVFNSFITNFKGILIAKSKRDFWYQVVKGKQGLIYKEECEESDILKEEADKFLAEEVKEEQSSRPQAEETTDELLMEH